MKETNYS